jgi:hypothetical protein
MNLHDELYFLCRSEYCRFQLAKKLTPKGKNYETKMKDQLNALVRKMFDSGKFCQMEYSKQVNYMLALVILCLRQYNDPKMKDVRLTGAGSNQMYEDAVENLAWTSFHLLKDSVDHSLTTFLRIEKTPKRKCCKRERFDQRGLCTQFGLLSDYHRKFKHAVRISEIHEILRTLDIESSLMMTLDEVVSYQHDRYQLECRVNAGRNGWTTFFADIFHYYPLAGGKEIGKRMRNERLPFPFPGNAIYYGTLLGGVYSLFSAFVLLTRSYGGDVISWITGIVGLINICFAIIENRRRKKRNEEFLRLWYEKDERDDILMARYDHAIMCSSGVDKEFYINCSVFIAHDRSLRRWQNLMLFGSFFFNLIAMAVLYDKSKNHLVGDYELIALAFYYTAIFIEKALKLLLLLVRLLLNCKIDIRTEFQIIFETEDWICTRSATPFEETAAILGMFDRGKIVAVKNWKVLSVTDTRTNLQYFFDRDYFRQMLGHQGEDVQNVMFLGNSVVQRFNASEEEIRSLIFGDNPMPSDPAGFV